MTLTNSITLSSQSITCFRMVEERHCEDTQALVNRRWKRHTVTVCYTLELKQRKNTKYRVSSSVLWRNNRGNNRDNRRFSGLTRYVRSTLAFSYDTICQPRMDQFDSVICLYWPLMVSFSQFPPRYVTCSLCAGCFCMVSPISNTRCNLLYIPNRTCQFATVMALSKSTTIER